MTLISHGSTCAKKMYCMNDVLVFQHHGLLIYLDIGYHDSFHDVNILRTLELYNNWHSFFNNGDKYFEYLLGDPNYMCECIFMMWWFKRCELALGQAWYEFITTYNKMHTRYKVWVGWGGELRG
jgi:hypothetical protein